MYVLGYVRIDVCTYRGMYILPSYIAIPYDLSLGSPIAIPYDLLPNHLNLQKIRFLVLASII
ncbi:hypothetical protein Patl1_23800 [Pistacia atlantica]|uniref:Uncharacterized protein n=1 Tax=Pistacia atlantica TaxID=434234 RepID=A0ACC0ZUY3_9ROSI|nr:hypothetical protein Patl1_23800 [Pistacia atlantica]